MFVKPNNLCDAFLNPKTGKELLKFLQKSTTRRRIHKSGKKEWR